MAQLIEMRRRIKAIETIQKITHAMRVIAMSNQGNLKNKEKTVTAYTASLTQLFHLIKQQTSSWTNKVLYPSDDTPQKTLVIVVGSQKGLCGGFNAATLRLFHQFVPYQADHNLHCIVVGKHIIEGVSRIVGSRSLISYPEFSSHNLLTIATELTKEIFDPTKEYTQVFLFSSKPKTIFIQQSQRTRLIPFVLGAETLPTEQSLQDYAWKQDPAEILDILARQCFQANIQTLLFQSLLAEQAARFLAMNNATTNADSLLETAQLQYNKLRQAKITKELAELTGNF